MLLLSRMLQCSFQIYEGQPLLILHKVKDMTFEDVLGHPEGQPPKDVRSLPILCGIVAMRGSRICNVLSLFLMGFPPRGISRAISRVQCWVRIWGTSKIANIFEDF
jgi:hypothetical protein